MTFALYILRPEPAFECPVAEIPQFTTLVPSPAPHGFALQPKQIHMHGCTCAGLTWRFVFKTVVLHVIPLHDCRGISLVCT